ncbi:MAG: Mrp/NBP35 family ATP-binding protein [Candidatus Marinimicrobia bacterium]|nr:Mrp/NBP35 family ATP-binding protein [Candidatus Neomarinimicrobiota bacterium]MBL7023381.1 Mrp/NBP35 family ATP-binding protein [Candidatus Neomarinimicrobiota bacterium]MBL7109738.1 Mrp/NBP35 family ATP-binding protein [Candidatus Neomarinimicrobiota bacterium]
MTEKQILELLKNINYPGFTRDIVSFGMVDNIAIDKDTVEITLSIDTKNNDLKSQLTNQITELISSETDKLKIIVNIQESKTDKSQTIKTNKQAPTPKVLDNIKHVIAVSSGKGGVGKSTVAVNIASILSENYKVGILDLDIYGPSLPMLMGIQEVPSFTEDEKIIPLEKHNIKLMSFGFISGNQAPVIWRGPLVGRMTKQFIDDVIWGELDFLILDLPPGTGDVQLTLSQTLELTGAIIVTTPQELAVLDVKKGTDMFRKVNTPVLGIVENMSHFLCPHCNQKSLIFSQGGGKKESERSEIPLLGQIPLSQALVESSDEGNPFVFKFPKSEITSIYKDVVSKIINNIG